jgi:NAD(P)-dependent dehydrogenase (short-subunit alcohol dehydrogenase family)
MTDQLFNIKDKVIVITGGMGQLGVQFSLALLERGAKVAIFDINIDREAIEDKFRDYKNNPNIIIQSTDILKKQSIISSLEMVKERWGVPHALINNAALDSPPDTNGKEVLSFEKYSEETWDKVLDVNIKGTFLACQVIGSEMANKKRGSIINISSIYGIVSPDQRIYDYKRVNGESFYKPVSYSVSKSAILNLTRYLATYWAEKNIRVNTLTFGGVFNNQDEKFLKGYCSRVPLGRMAHEDEYSGAIIFLISDASSYMTGSNMIIDGGWTAW